MHNQNWDDLRFVLAVAEEGSVSAAARRLRVNHATVLRRVAAFEDRIGLQLFERTSSGYVVPPDHRRVIDAAREAAAAINAVDRVAQGVEMRLTGTLCLTSTDTFCQTVLPPICRELTAEGEALCVEMSCTNAHLDLARMEADITVRPTMRLPDGLIGERAGALGLAAYGPASAPTRDWLGLRGPLERSRVAEIMETTKPGPSAPRRTVSSSCGKWWRKASAMPSCRMCWQPEIRGWTGWIGPTWPLRFRSGWPAMPISADRHGCGLSGRGSSAGCWHGQSGWDHASAHGRYSIRTLPMNGRLRLRCA